ncbi:MAG: universal stress protein family [Nitrospirae bacterium]|nr:universal stress protein family [Nitrospirota bacterium]
MYRKVLAAVNEHLNSEVAARYAMHLARAAGAKLFLYSVRQPGQTEAAFELARDAAQRLQHRAREIDIDAECLFETGDPVEKIRAIVLAEGIDLVFTATRREDVKHRIIRGGTTARRLLPGLPCSVALVRVVHMGRTHPREILVALKKQIDHIPERSEFTALLAKAFEARVHLFHVTRPVKKFFHGEMHLTPVEWEEKVPPDMSRFISHLDGYGVDHEKRLSPGKAGKSIAIEAASRRRDLIVMGASERGIIDQLLHRTPVEEVLRETPCNLIILKPGE